MTRSSGTSDPREHYDYAIIGGGVSGLYTAWRLLDHDPGTSVAVFEQSDRVGGRLLTWNPGGDNAGRHRNRNHQQSDPFHTASFRSSHVSGKRCCKASYLSLSDDFIPLFQRAGILVHHVNATVSLS